jgi:hypothetical protein
MAGHEILLGYAYLESTLGNDATLLGLAPGGVNRALAQPNTAIPYIITAFHTGIDTVTMNAFRVLTNLVFQVKRPVSIHCLEARQGYHQVLLGLWSVV